MKYENQLKNNWSLYFVHIDHFNRRVYRGDT